MRSEINPLCKKNIYLIDKIDTTVYCKNLVKIENMKEIRLFNKSDFSSVPKLGFCLMVLYDIVSSTCFGAKKVFGNRFS